MDHGWRVWISTCACIADRYRRDNVLTALARRIGASDSAVDAAQKKAAVVAASQALVQANIPCGIAHVVTLMLRRLASEKPKFAPEVRFNVLRTLKFAASKLSGPPLACVALAAVPVIALLRSVARQQAAAADRERQMQQSNMRVAQTSTGTAAPPYMDIRVEPLRGQEIWITLELLVRALPAFSGLRYPGSIPQHTSTVVDSCSAAIVCRPDPDGFSCIVSFLQELVNTEMGTLPPPQTPELSGVSASVPIKSGASESPSTLVDARVSRDASLTPIDATICVWWHWRY